MRHLEVKNAARKVNTCYPACLLSPIPATENRVAALEDANPANPIPPFVTSFTKVRQANEVPVTISIFGSTSIPFPLYFSIHFPILFKSSFTISITKIFYFQPFYYSAFYYSAFYYSASLSLSIIQPSIIQLYYSATFLLL